MRNYQRRILYVAIAAVAAFAFFWLCNNCLITPSHHDSHNWLHKQLQLTSQQEVQLKPIEARFHESEAALTADIQRANVGLAKALAKDKNYSPRVAQAIENIHHAQGALQKLTIEHFFEMQSVLTPEQITTLNQLATDALVKSQ